MPYQHRYDPENSAPEHSGAVSHGVGPATAHVFDLWPHQSLPRTGFVWFIGATAVLLSLPLVAVLGTPVLWGLLPFLMLALSGLWWALQRNRSDADLREVLEIRADTITLLRHGPRGANAEWSANPYWVTTALHPTGGPVANYLTLRGGDREVELGAFLSEPERLALRAELDEALKAVTRPPSAPQGRAANAMGR